MHFCFLFRRFSVSTHSRAEAAAKLKEIIDKRITVSTHSRAEAAATPVGAGGLLMVFQHTAARRRLPM